jgi:5-methylcytosine-specific restriction endonuclease McrA
MKRNPLLRRINDHKRRSKIINNGNSSIINYKYFRKKMIQIKCCTYCNKELSYNKSEYNKQNYATIDHVIPLINGGTNELNNLVFCCRSCNVKKGRRGVDYFESELRKL